jgi:uncharacterized membrane-anchored protein
MDGIIGLIISLISGVVGGAILMIIVGFIKQAIVKYECRRARSVVVHCL